MYGRKNVLTTCPLCEGCRISHDTCMILVCTIEESTNERRPSSSVINEVTLLSIEAFEQLPSILTKIKCKYEQAIFLRSGNESLNRFLEKWSVLSAKYPALHSKFSECSPNFQKSEFWPTNRPHLDKH